MKVVCLDFEGVLIPDIWPVVAKELNISDLEVTTRDIADYCELMDYRVNVCHEYGVTLQKIQNIIQTLRPLDGAFELVQWIRNYCQFIILSDTFYEFVPYFLEALNFPALFCHTISYNKNSRKLDYRLRQHDQKRHAILALQSLNFEVFASGDSYNDTSMMEVADAACFFDAAPKVYQEFSHFENAKNYEELKLKIQDFLN